MPPPAIPANYGQLPPQKRRNIQLIRLRMLRSSAGAPPNGARPDSSVRRNTAAGDGSTAIDVCSNCHNLILLDVVAPPKSVWQRPAPAPQPPPVPPIIARPRRPEKIIIKHRSRHRHQLRRSNSVQLTGSTRLLYLRPLPLANSSHLRRHHLFRLNRSSGSQPAAARHRPHVFTRGWIGTSYRTVGSVASASIRSRRCGISCCGSPSRSP